MGAEGFKGGLFFTAMVGELFLFFTREVEKIILTFCFGLKKSCLGKFNLIIISGL